MKKVTDLFEKLAVYQLDIDATKNIKGGERASSPPEGTVPPWEGG